MLTGADQEDLDAGPRRGPPDRLCIACRKVKPITEMIRFVVGPDGAVVPDVKQKLPGRGVWVTASRAAVQEAARSRAFARSFKRDVRPAPDLDGTTERLLERAALDALAIAHKAGRVAAGFAKTEAALMNERVVGLVHAADAGPEGVRKLDAIARRTAEATAGLAAGTGGPKVIDMFTSMQLDLALGRSNVIHAAVLAGPASTGFLARCQNLERFRGEDRSA